MSATASNNDKILNFLILSTDIEVAKRFQLMVNRIKESQPSFEFRVFPGVDANKVSEYLENYKMHSIIVDDSYLDTGPDKWITAFKEKIENNHNKGSPVYIVTQKPDVEKTKTYVKSGFTDVLVSPLDFSLTVQKLALHNTETKLLAEAQLFTLETSHEVDLGFRYKTKSISEFGMTIKTDQELEVGMVLTIYTSFLEKDLAAQVREVKKTGSHEFDIFLLFLGVDPAESQALRKWMKNDYALKNQKESA